MVLCLWFYGLLCALFSSLSLFGNKYGFNFVKTKPLHTVTCRGRRKRQTTTSCFKITLVCPMPTYTLQSKDYFSLQKHVRVILYKGFQCSIYYGHHRHNDTWCSLLWRPSYDCRLTLMLCFQSGSWALSVFSPYLVKTVNQSMHFLILQFINKI